MPFSPAPSLTAPQITSPRDTEQPPHEFLCPINQDIMEDPVVAQDGHSYERQAIEDWFERCGGVNVRSPMTNLPVELPMLWENRNLKSQICAWQDREALRSGDGASKPTEEAPATAPYQPSTLAPAPCFGALVLAAAAGGAVALSGCYIFRSIFSSADGVMDGVQCRANIAGAQARSDIATKPSRRPASLAGDYTSSQSIQRELQSIRKASAVRSGLGSVMRR